MPATDTDVVYISPEVPELYHARRDCSLLTEASNVITVCSMNKKLLSYYAARIDILPCVVCQDQITTEAIHVRIADAVFATTDKFTEYEAFDKSPSHEEVTTFFLQRLEVSLEDFRDLLQ